MNFPQTATYWSIGKRDKFGNLKYESPISLQVRWESKRTLMLDDNGNEVVFDSVVYCYGRVTTEGYLYLGDSSEVNPENVSGAKKIKAINFTPNINNTKELTKIWL